MALPLDTEFVGVAKILPNSPQGLFHNTRESIAAISVAGIRARRPQRRPRTLCRGIQMLRFAVTKDIPEIKSMKVTIVVYYPKISRCSSNRALLNLTRKKVQGPTEVQNVRSNEKLRRTRAALPMLSLLTSLNDFNTCRFLSEQSSRHRNEQIST